MRLRRAWKGTWNRTAGTLQWEVGNRCWKTILVIVQLYHLKHGLMLLSRHRLLGSLAYDYLETVH